MDADIFIDPDHILRRDIHILLNPAHQDERKTLRVVIGDPFRRHPAVLSCLSVLIRQKGFHDHLRDQVPHDALKGVLSGRMRHMAVESLVFQNCRKDKGNRLPLHVVLKQDPRGVDDFLPADPFEKLVFILEMIIKGHSDYSGAIRDLLDRDLLHRLLKDQLFKAV